MCLFTSIVGSLTFFCDRAKKEEEMQLFSVVTEGGGERGLSLLVS